MRPPQRASSVSERGLCSGKCLRAGFQYVCGGDVAGDVLVGPSNTCVVSVTAAAGTRRAGQEHTIHPGERVAISHILSSRDKDLFGEDAESYRPRREEWSSSAAEGADTFQSNDDEYKMTVFSQGVHKCSGERVAAALVRLIKVEMGLANRAAPPGEQLESAV